MTKDNFAFDKVQRLPGNIGYEKFRLFAYPYLAAATASSAMDFVANTDALIIDLRENAGDDPATRRWWRSWPAIVSTRACACTTS
ncbi:hypothetical protein ABFU78_09515 [Xanthomonas campestris pv. campestris]|uniref:hypothetical protein n=1 Tax=Xanthomonas campestris TaxID=339 RepID=UPI00388D36B7|nr:hypothetical protein VDP59_009715 [Xanthomonas campestris pv. campestris]